MVKLLLTATFLIATTFINAQSPAFNWAKSVGGYHGYSTGTDVVVDASGNVFTTGYFEGRVDFDPGIGSFFLTSAGFNDIFVAKSDASGNFLWAKRFGGILDDQSNSIAVSGLGNICIAGSFSGTADFDPTATVYNLISAGGTDIFVSVLDTIGNLIWARQFGDAWDDAAKAVAIDSSENIYSTGRFIGIVDFDPGAGNMNLNTGGNTPNTFISKLNSIGNFAFAKQMSGSISGGNSITIDSSGNICTAGYFEYTVDFDPGPGVYGLTSQAGSLDVFISKLSNSGNFIWAKKLEGPQSENVTDIKTDAAGNVYTVGTFMGSGDFDPGPAVHNLTSGGTIDIFISKLDGSGNYIWAVKIGGATNSEKVNSISLDGSGNIYTIGTFDGTVDFDPGPGTFNLTPTTNFGVFVLKLNASGNFTWAKVLEATSTVYGNGIAVDPAGNVLTTGAFQEICDFDPGAGMSNLVALGGKFLFTSKLDASGNFIWAKSAGEGASTYSKAMTTDAFGNIYVTGYFLGKVDFDPGPGVHTLSTSESDLEGDIFVTKFSSSGNLIWAKRMGGISHDLGNAIAVDAAGNVYTAGRFMETADFNPGAGVFNLTSSTTYYNTFVSKLNANGNFVWAKKLSSTFIEEINSIALDSSGNLFTAGSYLNGTNSYEIYLNKLDPSGNVSWSKIYGGTLKDAANAIGTDVSGNIYMVGYFEGTTDFDPGAGIFNQTTTDRDIFVTKLDGSGNFVWAKQMGGTGYDEATAIALDATGKIHVTGYFHDTADFDPGPGTFNLTSSAGQPDIFITKLDNTGIFLWAKQFEGNSSEFVRSIAVDSIGNVYTTGNFNGTTDFDPGPGTFNLISAGYLDVFISKLDAAGNFFWAQQIGSLRNEEVNSIALDVSANIYTSGDFYEEVDFDPTPGVSNLPAKGSPDLFIHKMSQCVPPTALIIPAGPTTFCSGGFVTLNANTGTGLNYQWLKNSAPIPGAISSSYNATTPGSYSVFISNSTLCSETSNIVKVKVPCIPIGPNQGRTIQFSEAESEDIKVYPNPTSGEFVLDAPPGKFQIFNALGQHVFTSDIYGNDRNVNLSKFPDGIYILKIRTEKSNYTKKILLKH